MRLGKNLQEICGIGEPNNTTDVLRQQLIGIFSKVRQILFMF